MNKPDNHNLENLAKTIEKIGSFKLDQKRKKQLKQNLFAKIKLQEKVAEVGIKTKMPAVAKAKVKEAVLGFLDVYQPKFSLLGLFNKAFSGYKKALSGVTAFAMLLLVFVSYSPYQAPIANADAFAFVTSVSGDAHVKRGEAILKVYPGMEVEDGDILKTQSNAQLEVSYIDSSHSRFDVNTKAVFQLPKAEDIEQKVQVNVFEGKVWSKVFDLNDEEVSYVFKAPDLLAEVDKGALDLEVSDRAVKVGVFNEEAKIVTKKGISKLVSGEKMVVSKETVQLAKISDEEKDNKWVAANLRSDKDVYAQVERRILEKRLVALGEDIENVEKADLAKQLAENKETLMLSFDDVNDKRAALEVAEKNFVKAQVKITQTDADDDQKDLARQAVVDFAKEVQEFDDLIAQVEVKDKTYAEDLKVYLASKVESQKESLNVVLPSSPLYEVKESVNQIEQDLAKDKAEMAAVTIKQTTEKTEDIKNLVDLGETEEAQVAADKLIEDLVKAAEQLEEEKDEDEEEEEDEKTEEELANEFKETVETLEKLKVVEPEDVADKINYSLPEDSSFKEIINTPTIDPLLVEPVVEIENNLDLTTEINVPDIFLP
jgi:hypothetical protein